MTRHGAGCLIAVIVLANGASTVLYSGVGPTEPTPPIGRAAGNPALQAITKLLTVPIATPGITDVRDVALIASLGLALLVTGVFQAANLCHRSRRNPSAKDPPSSRNPAATWMTWMFLGVVALALCSAFRNGTLDLSWGWIVRFAAGAVWAILIARTFTPAMTRRALAALLLLALGCMALTLADRAARDAAYFRWPIGPITITAALAAVWAALAGTLAVGRTLIRDVRPALAIWACAFLVAIYVLQQTGRRAPALGLITAGLAAGSLLLWSRYRSRLMKGCVLGLLAVSITGAALYVAAQRANPAREVSGPVALRLAYWKLSSDLILGRPWLGSGPDTFPVEMTNLVAPLRAESPHFYHGNITQYAHNEWIQAAVELGLPAALAVLALPLGVVGIALRSLRSAAAADPSPRHRARRCPVDPRERALIVALIAGVTAVLVTECASITLRVPAMATWYWTLLGLLASLCAARPPAPTAAAKRPVLRSATRGTRAILAVACFAVPALACFAVSAVELTRAGDEARQVRGADGRFATRLYADKTISARYKAAVLASREAHAHPQRQLLQTAQSSWHDLYQTLPALHDVPAMYADILILSGGPDAARAVLEDGLSERLNPYNLAANVMFARRFAEDPVDRLRCVQRALRAGALDASLGDILIDLREEATAHELLDRELPAARALAAGSADAPISGPTVELLRISAFLKERSGLIDEAIADQRLIAEFYRRLERETHPARRAHDAEADAFLVLAQMLYNADPADYREAYDAIVAAEYFAVLGIRTERMSDPKPEKGFVGGVVVPTEFPERLHPLWNLSALLHVLAGNEHFLIQRILAGLPVAQWNDRAVRSRLARIYRRAYDDMVRLPPERRPDHFAHLQDMAHAFADARRDGTDRPARQVPPP